MARFYITTSIMYTNGAPHIGFALELVQADAIARWRRMHGDEVHFLTGTDEHGTKIMRSAQEAGEPTKEFVDRITGQVGELCTRLDISNSDFIRTTDRVRHWPGAQKLWQTLAENGDIYKKSYEGNYCVGHEAFIKQSELVDGCCPLHRTRAEVVQEENYFFRLSKYRDRVRELIQSGAMRIVPETRTAEILNLLKDAEDVSFSRPSAQLPWGIPVPGDESQTMYVWADALTNYISALGYGTDEARMSFWPAQVHLIGKDILRFHAMIWPAMLMAASLPTPEQIFVHGFITVGGEKMSKSLGNVIDPFELLASERTDVIRYYLLREMMSSDDSDFSYENLRHRYTADLANGLGNLVQRVATMAETKLGGKIVYGANLESTEASLRQIYDDSEYEAAFHSFRLHDASAAVWAKIAEANAYLNDRAPWKLEGEAQRNVLTTAVAMVRHIAWLLQPFMPSTAASIGTVTGGPLTQRCAEGEELLITKPEPMFPKPVETESAGA
jgi:methionyl-tRNA synthetase